MDTATSPTLGQQLNALLAPIGTWINAHQDEIIAIFGWATVRNACAEARLYAPIDAVAWRQLVEACEQPSPDYEAIIVSLYGPSGVGFDSLVKELSTEPLLRDRRREVDQVVNSLVDGRYYVTICGALPLVEWVLTKAAGSWTQPSRYKLDARLDAADPKEQTALLIKPSAVEMVLSEIPEVWKDRKHPSPDGELTGELSRHLVLHGTGRGWDNKTNAIRSVLLLAAAAAVADVLLSPRSI